MNIQQATALIADIDPAAARIFASQPFNRHTLVTALHRSLSNSQYAHLADEISVMLRSAIDAQRNLWTEAA